MFFLYSKNNVYQQQKTVITNMTIEVTSTMPFLQFARNKRHYDKGLLLQLLGI